MGEGLYVGNGSVTLACSLSTLSETGLTPMSEKKSKSRFLGIGGATQTLGLQFCLKTIISSRPIEVATMHRRQAVQGLDRRPKAMRPTP
jgi:hypothetical protein